MVNIMKDIRFWRAEYLGDIIGCDQSNRSSKRNALRVVRGAAPQEWIFCLHEIKLNYRLRVHSYKRRNVEGKKAFFTNNSGTKDFSK